MYIIKTNQKINQNQISIPEFLFLSHIQLGNDKTMSYSCTTITNLVGCVWRVYKMIDNILIIKRK